MPYTSHDYGTIEGTLTSMCPCPPFIFPSYTLLFVYDDLIEREIPCYLPAKLQPQAFAAVGKRVAIQGIVYATKDKSHIAMDGETLEVFPDPDTLPSFEDVKGMCK